MLARQGFSYLPLVLDCYILLLDKSTVGFAITKLTEILKQQNDFVPALFALAIGKFVERNEKEALVILKILAKKDISLLWGDYLERSWLLYADNMINVRLKQLSHNY